MVLLAIGCTQAESSKDDIAVVSGNLAALERRVAILEEQRVKLRDAFEKIQTLELQSNMDIYNRIESLETKVENRP